MIKFIKGLESLINSHEKQLFTVEEVADLCGSFISDDYNLKYTECLSTLCLSTGSDERMTINRYFFNEDYIHFSDVDQTYSIRKPNHYVVISECRCDYYITHAGILLLLSDLNKFKVSDSELECLEESKTSFKKNIFN